MPGEVLLGGRGSAAAHDGQSIEVGGEHAVVNVGQREDVGDEATDRPTADEVEEGPRSLAVLVDDPGVCEQLEMPGDSWLRLRGCP